MSTTKSDLIDGHILPTLARLTVPNFAAMAISTVVAVCETAYVGQLGTAALAGLALVFPLVMLMQMMSAGAMGGGVSSAVSRALGSGDPTRAAALALHAAVIGTVAGLFFSTVFLVYGRDILSALGGRGAALEEGLTFGRVVFLGVTSIWLTNTLASVLRGSGNMRTPSLVLFCTSALQIMLGFVLGLDFGPIPRFGMTGVALAAVIAFAGAMLAFLWILMTGRSAVRLSFDRALLSGEMFRDILKVGALSCASPVMSVATILIITAIIARFGTEALAGYGIGSRLEFLLVPITFAVGVASIPMVGMAIGAGRVMRARQVAWTAGLVAAVSMGAIGVVVAVVPDAWGRLFTNDPAVLETSRHYFLAAGPAYFFYGLGLCLYFASQGSGQMLGPVLAQAVRLLIVAIGGWWLVRENAPAWHLFVLIGVAMVAYGLATALGLRLSRWGSERRRG